MLSLVRYHTACRIPLDSIKQMEQRRTECGPISICDIVSLYLGRLYSVAAADLAFVPMVLARQDQGDGINLPWDFLSKSQLHLVSDEKRVKVI